MNSFTPSLGQYPPAGRAPLRAGAALAVSVALHLLLVGSAWLGLINLFPATPEEPPPVVQARLLPPPPPPTPPAVAAPEAAPAPAAKPAPVRHTRPRPAPEAPPVLAAPQSPASVTSASGTEGSAPTPGGAEVASNAPAVASAPPAAAPVRTTPPPLPAAARIEYELTMESNNFKATAIQDWRMQGSRYRVRLGAGLRILFVVRTVVMESTGSVTPAGLKPERYVDERNGKPTIVTFDGGTAQVSEPNGNQKSIALPSPASDFMSLPYDLAFNPDIPVGTVLMMTNRENVEAVRLVDKHDETLQTERFVANTRFYDFRRVDGVGGAQVWLSLDKNWLPAKLRIAGRDGPISLVATRYDLNPAD